MGLAAGGGDPVAFGIVIGFLGRGGSGCVGGDGGRGGRLLRRLAGEFGFVAEIPRRNRVLILPEPAAGGAGGFLRLGVLIAVMQWALTKSAKKNEKKEGEQA